MSESSSDGPVSLSAEPIVVPDRHDKPPTILPKVDSSCSDTTGNSFLTLLSGLEKEYIATGDRSQFASRYQAWIEQNGAASPALFAAWFNLGVELSGAGDKAGAIDAYRNAL